METDRLLAGSLLSGLGIWFVWGSFQFYFCRLQSKAHIYLLEGTRPDYAAVSYGIGPWGIGLICTGIAIIGHLPPDTTLSILTYIAGPFFVLGFGLTAWQPRWLMPAWLRWIQEYNYDIRSLLGKEACQAPNWTQRIRSQADLESWVAEVRQKYYRTQPTDSYAEALQRAGMTPHIRSPWGIGILVIAIASGLGQLFLGNAFVGFVLGGGLSLALYWWLKKDSQV
jgi:hypothetical protein